MIPFVSPTCTTKCSFDVDLDNDTISIPCFNLFCFRNSYNYMILVLIWTDYENLIFLYGNLPLHLDQNCASITVVPLTLKIVNWNRNPSTWLVRYFLLLLQNRIIGKVKNYGNLTSYTDWNCTVSTKVPLTLKFVNCNGNLSMRIFREIVLLPHNGTMW